MSVPTTAQNAAATIDETLLAELTGMVKTEEIAAADAGPAVLKINYDEESVHGTGVWVLGQKTDKDGNIIEQGVSVNSVIILTTKLQHSYYDEKNPRNSFSTQMFDWGGKAPDKAEFDARLVSIGKPDEGRFRVVMFGLAVLTDGKTVECVSYYAGTTYPNFKAHYDAITCQKINGKMYNLPPFVCVTHLLDPDKAKNGSRVYFIGKFAAGPFLPRDMILLCGEKREEVYDYIDRLNANSDLGVKKKQHDNAAPPQAPPKAPSSAPIIQSNFAMPNLDTMKSANIAPADQVNHRMEDDVPFDVGGGDDIGDLEEAIRAAL